MRNYNNHDHNFSFRSLMAKGDAFSFRGIKMGTTINEHWNYIGLIKKEQIEFDKWNNNDDITKVIILQLMNIINRDAQEL